MGVSRADGPLQPGAEPIILWRTDDLQERQQDYENALNYLPADDPDRPEIERDMRQIAFELGQRALESTT